MFNRHSALPIFRRLLVCAIALVICQAIPAQAQSPSSQSLLISELQTGGCQELTGTCQENGKLEFIELYNPTTSDLVVEGWKVEYLSASHTGATAPTRTVAELHGTLMASSYALLSYVDYVEQADAYFGADSTTNSGLFARSGGHVRVVDNLGTVIDLVSWGNAQQLQSWWRAPALAPGYSIKRILQGDPMYTDGKVFTVPSLPLTPQGGGLIESTEPTVPVCEGVVLSEILPNVAGSDDGKEFVEIHNPTAHDIKLTGCSLKLGESGPIYNLPDVSISAGSYRSFFDNETGITLPNSKGETIWLLTSSNEEGVRYADGLADDQSWSLINGEWKATFTPTPGQPNSFSEAGRGGEDESTPCDVGQERNPETNRCRKIATTATLAVCKPGQVRNTGTNRCRSIGTTSSTLTPCKPGQIRNPETNRCRSVSAASGLKPCELGQERNPETNRCRKTTTGTQLGAVHDVPNGQTGNMAGWWLAGVGALGAAGYGVYEWRREIASALGKLKDKFIPPGPAS